MDRAQIIDLIVRKAHEHGVAPWELLGGAIAESALDPNAWRQGLWPDQSAGLFQQTVKFADEGDHTASPENIDLIKRLYFDPVHATEVAARKFKAYRAREPSAADAWSRYNWPAQDPAKNPNRANYERGLTEAQRILGVPPMPVTYNLAEPDIRQNDPWSCSCTSARWALKALGRKPTEEWIENQMLQDGIVTRAQGLTDASGAQLAAWLQAQYGEYGYLSNNEPIISWDWAVHEGGQPDGSGHQYPVLIGGRGWNHWVTLKTFDPATGQLALMNPAPGWMGVQMSMDESTFRALGPFSAVRLWHPDLFAAVLPPPPTDTRLPRARALLEQAITVLDEPAP